MDWLTADVVLKVIVTVMGLWAICSICACILWALCVEDGWRDVRRRWRVWQIQRRSEFSRTWRRQQDQQESRVEFHGPVIRFPIRKERS